MYKALLNGKSFDVTIDQETWSVNGKPLSWDVTSLGQGHYHVLLNNKGYTAEVVKIDREAKVVELKINGLKHSVQLRDKFDLLLEKMGLSGV
ncbi:MAG: acetyl-CoA carboxylase biotin carboxyl carrier protein subunit, partial [Cyclobacteriaceae bacterium]|nr:acetyl-CoA carboxylase biotin carboxyl carrier protein subunit [Cyclobacteriaceae bacterium]